MKCTPFFGLILCVALTTLMACSDEHSQEQDPAQPPVAQTIPQHLTLALTSPQSPTGGLSTELHFQRQEGIEAPRAAEIFLRISDNLTLRSNTALDAAENAQKELVVQEPEPGLLRVILYATSNLTPMNTGGLVRLNFDKTKPGKASVAFVPERINLAPSEATRGLSLGQPFIMEDR